MHAHNLNTLLRAIDVQNITLEHTQRGATQQWVFNNIIKPRYHISKGTYYRYLDIPAKKLIKQFEPQVGLI